MSSSNKRNAVKINGPKPFTLNRGKLLSIANNSITNTYINSLLKRRRNKRQYVVSANNAGNVNGFAIIGPNYNINNRKFMYLHLIAVRSKSNKGISRGKGVGTALLARIVKNAKNRKVNEILLNAIPSAKSWYTKVGFKRPNYSMGNNNMMALNLRASR
jgi:N-acetylglutamate synthase-like GNAT family acetyltransferase